MPDDGDDVGFWPKGGMHDHRIHRPLQCQLVERIERQSMTEHGGFRKGSTNPTCAEEKAGARSFFTFAPSVLFHLLARIAKLLISVHYP